jgi:hypothetical protein
MPATARCPAHRITALALACAVNALFLSLWLFSRARIAPEAVATAMIWMTAPLQRPPLPQSLVRESRAASAARIPVPIIESPVPELSTAITVPPIDWYAEGARSAREVFKDQLRETPEPSLDSKPQALVLPDRSNLPHKAGDTEHFEGGEVITWVNERCYYSNRPSAISFGGASQKVCKTRSMSQRRSEARAAEMEKAIKPDYLDRPLPQPP